MNAAKAILKAREMVLYLPNFVIKEEIIRTKKDAGIRMLAFVVKRKILRTNIEKRGRIFFRIVLKFNL